MKDGVSEGEHAESSRPDLYQDYINWYLQSCPEVRPCRDGCVMRKAAQYLFGDSEPSDTFTVFPFYEAVKEGCGGLNPDGRKFLSTFIKATELLETLCVNLFIQPWRKEIKTLKTFTGPFVYCLLPVFNSSTLKSVLASIGYLPHTDFPTSEYRLSKDANPYKAILVGFELLLARVECYHLLEILEKDQLGPQAWQEVLLRRVGPIKLEKKTKGENEEEKKNKMEEADRKQVPLYLNTKLTVNPLPKPRRHHVVTDDESIIEMHKTYPDLAFRGRPLLQETNRSSSKLVHTTSTNRAAELSKRDYDKSTKGVAATIHSKSDGSKADEMFSDSGESSGCNDSNSGWVTTSGDAVSTRFSNTDDGLVDDKPSCPQAISLHITLRAGSTAEQSLKLGESQRTAEAAPLAWTQQQTTTDLQNKRLATQGFPSLSSMDEQQALQELAERMGQLHVQAPKGEVNDKEESKRGEESTNNDRRKTKKKKSTEEEAEGQNLRKPVTDPVLSHAASRSTRSSQV